MREVLKRHPRFRRSRRFPLDLNPRARCFERSTGMAVIGRTQVSDLGKVLPHKSAYRLLQHPHPVKPFQANFQTHCPVPR